MSNVSRSIYQKVCEENKRLKEDIKILCRHKGCISDWVITATKWSEIFEREDELREVLQVAAIKYIKEHPEINIHNRKEETK